MLKKWVGFIVLPLYILVLSEKSKDLTFFLYLKGHDNELMIYVPIYSREAFA